MSGTVASTPEISSPAERGPRLAEIVVTLGAPGRYHYKVPDRLAAQVQVGARVLVPFGSRKVTGVVVPSASRPPEGVALLDISEVLDAEPSLSGELVELCLWVADYYAAPPGEVLKAALPAGSGVSARRVIALTDAGRAASDGEGTALPPKQRALLARLITGPIPATGLGEAMRRNVDALRALGLVDELEERDAARVRLRRERVVALAHVDVDQIRIAHARAPKRLAVIEALLRAGATTAPDAGALERAIPVAVLGQEIAGASTIVRELAKLGVVTVFEREVSPMALAVPSGMTVGPVPELTDEQAHAVAEITAALRARVTPGDDTAAPAKPAFAPFLLHGVTGSGKTEVYLRVIADALALGKTALVLVPEISLTPQLAARFRSRFGDHVAILHSGLTEQARLGEWRRLRSGEATIAVGARSAVFAPLTSLGVIVVDEEHDGSFKQEEGVRYHARDVAMVRAQRAGAVCVLGSATPSLESYAHAERGQYKKLVLTQRPLARRAAQDAAASAAAAPDGAPAAAPDPAGPGAMPTVEIVDLRTHMPDSEAFLSSPLRKAIGETLAAGDQIILFLNRRGFSTFVLCRGCGHSFRCKHCSVSMTYHRHSDQLRCHYCNASQRVPDICPSCGGKDTIIRKGLGTEKIAESVAAEFPKARVARLDRDVATGAKIETVLARVGRREVDILVGTQMVTKGHDFPGVTLVGVLCADTGLNMPDFRASERTFQLLAQVAGRAGRGARAGKVIVQTYRPGSHAVVSAAAHDYEQFYRAEFEARAELGYPPHGRLIAVRIDGPDAHEVAGAAKRLAEVGEAVAKRPDLGGEVEIRGPVPAPIERLRNRTRWQIWLRGSERQALRRIARAMAATEVASAVRVILDVDPLSTL